MVVFMKNKILTLTLVLCFCACRKGDLLIVATNDTHSQIEVCGENMKSLAGLGGYAARAALIDSLRQQNANLLLFDAGDFSQGTPYFNMYKGRLEVEAYNRMGYDAVTLGNHEFDNGLDTLAARLREAKFKVVCSNYDVAGTQLEGLVLPTTIFSRAGWRVGIIGLGVNPEGLILQSNFGAIKYIEPLAVANHYADSLKTICGCDLVVALSHLGSDYEHEVQPSDEYIAANSRSIDVIIGGHTHKRMQKTCANLNGDSVVLIQSGKSGAYVGKIEITK